MATPEMDLRASLAHQLAALRGIRPDELPASLLDVVVRPVKLPGGEVYIVRPADWDALRDDEGAAARPVPYWARLWPSGEALAHKVAASPPRPAARVLELGCGLGLPSVVAARAGANVLATDASSDAVAFAAHCLSLNGVEATVARVDWQEDGDYLAEQGPFELVLAADVLYTNANVESALRLMPRLLEPNGELWLADPDRAGGRRFLQAARRSFYLQTRDRGEVRLHTLRPR